MLTVEFCLIKRRASTQMISKIDISKLPLELQKYLKDNQPVKDEIAILPNKPSKKL